MLTIASNQLLNEPLTQDTGSDVPSVEQNLNLDYPPFDTGIPDQYRVDIFLAEWFSIWLR